MEASSPSRLARSAAARFVATVRIETDNLCLDIGQAYPVEWSSKSTLDNFARALLGPQATWRDVAQLRLIDTPLAPAGEV